jgi:cyclopropane fatty-acyl-phospholipid synthase-like methyltransferase
MLQKLRRAFQRPAEARRTPEVQRYADMQRRAYDSIAGQGVERAKAAVHPHYDHAHRRAKYWLAFVLREFVDRRGNSSGKTIDGIVESLNQGAGRPKLLDFGCGVGRLMEACVASDYQVDGVDISAEMLKIASQSEELQRGKSRLILGSGRDCGDAPQNHYDIVYSMLCFQHICVRTIRQSILKSMHDCLTDRGMVYIQTHFFPHIHSSQVPEPHSCWTRDNTAAKRTNSSADAWVTPDQLGEVYADFAALFSDVRLQFITLRGFRSAEKPAEHLVISASKQPSLGSQLIPRETT